MARKQHFEFFEFLTVIIVDRNFYVITTWSLFPINECDLIEEIMLGYFKKMRSNSEGVLPC